MSTNLPTAAALARVDDYQPVIDLVTSGLTSSHNGRALEAFLGWYGRQGRPPLHKATVTAYRAHLLGQGLGPAAVNQSLSAVRKLAAEAADNGFLDPTAAAAIGRVKGVKAAGLRSGNWLSKAEAQALLDAPPATVKGARDRAILAVLLGTGLRRAECAALTFEQLAQRDGRWVIVDLVGKGGRVRTVPMPSWTKAAIDRWAAASGRSAGPVFVGVNKGGRVAGRALSPQAIYQVVETYGAAAGVDAAAHDLRRTFAKLAHKGGAPLEQIQLTLGHSTIQTTERYLGVAQNLESAPCDVLGLTLYQ